MSETRFVLIRHGESTWNAAGRWQGHGDPPLSPRGREQVARLAAELASAGIEEIVASDLRRAEETAAILGESVGVAPTSDARLREIDIGRWTGWTRAEIEDRDRARLAIFESGAPDARAGGGECRREIAERVHRAVSEIGERFDGRCVAIVAHLGALNMLLPGSRFANAEARFASAGELRSNAPPAADRARRASG